MAWWRGRSAFRGESEKECWRGSECECVESAGQHLRYEVPTCCDEGPTSASGGHVAARSYARSATSARNATFVSARW